jgi:AraC family transcriptional regulator
MHEPVEANVEAADQQDQELQPIIDSLLGLVGLSLDTVMEPWRASPRTQRLITRAKEFLEAHLGDPIRLTDVAHAVGASPAYLTDVFSRVEGIPLHRYLMQLRLARALVDLPDARDITTLALDLGFSSHSHFTLVFRRAFGCPPSEFRKLTRTMRRSAPPACPSVLQDRASPRA